MSVGIMVWDPNFVRDEDGTKVGRWVECFADSLGRLTLSPDTEIKIKDGVMITGTTPSGGKLEVGVLQGPLGPTLTVFDDRQVELQKDILVQLRLINRSLACLQADDEALDVDELDEIIE